MILTFFSILRWMIGWLDLLIITSIVYPLSYLPPHFTRFYFQPLYQYWASCFAKALGVQLKLHQKNIHTLPKQMILIGNHPSVFEDIGMSALFPVHYLAKSAVKNWWIVGRISQATGTFYVNREDKIDRQRSFEELVQALKEGESIGLYPEGGCKGRRIYLPFRYGVFELSMQSRVPIVPVFLHYESQIDFEWQNEHLLYKLWQIMRSKNRTANYYIYDAIDPTQFESKEAFCNYVQNCYLAWQKRYLD